MAEEKKKGFFGEFKTFISRGNIMDMAVGIIIGGAFTAIVTALTDGILRPIINYIFSLGGGDGLSSAYTFLKRVTTEVDGQTVVDFENSIYIDWGTFISAIINFLLIALVLFCIVKMFNKIRAAAEEEKAKIKEKIKKEETKEIQND